MLDLSKDECQCKSRGNIQQVQAFQQLTIAKVNLPKMHLDTSHGDKSWTPSIKSVNTTWGKEVYLAIESDRTLQNKGLRTFHPMIYELTEICSKDDQSPMGVS